MHAMDKVTDLRDTWRERRLRMRAEDLDQENRSMRERLRLLEDELENERDARSRILQALENLKPETIKVKGRRGGVIRLIVIGGTAYVLGAKAGRERYEQIRGWWQRVRTGGGDALDEAMEEMQEQQRSSSSNRPGDGSMPLSA